MKLIFLHIPKCGGNTFHSILERIYPGQCYDIRVMENGRLSVDEFLRLPSHIKAQIRVLKGHMPFGLHRSFEDEDDVRYVTFLRDPVERIISHYHYVMRKSGHYLHRTVAGSKMNLTDYALSDLTAELDNHQTRSLLNDPDIPINCITQQHFDEAVGNLKSHFIAFGITEQFDRSLILFRQKLAWTSYPFYIKANVRQVEADGKIDDKQLTEISGRNRWDSALYLMAKALFETEMQSITGFENELNTLVAANQAYANGYSLGRSTNPPGRSTLSEVFSRIMNLRLKTR